MRRSGLCQDCVQRPVQFLKEALDLRRDHLAAVQHHLYRLSQLPFRDGQAPQPSGLHVHAHFVYRIILSQKINYIF